MIYAFGDYELDLRGLELRRDGEACDVEPQVFDVLAHLVRHRDRVVTKRELLDEVWGHRFVTESTLSTRIMGARRAVGDDGRAQRVIKTIHGRGFRFVAEVEERGNGAPAEVPAVPCPVPAPDQPPLGREAETRTLRAALDDAFGGRRRVVFVTGEAGLGKTTLVDAFLAEAAGREPAPLVARGHGVEHQGPGEAYGPFLEALGRVLREPEGDELLALLLRSAPSWAVQMPFFVDAATLEELHARTVGTHAMPREMVETLEAWTESRPVVLVLEDLHWSDPSTADLVGWIARRREPARLLLVATFRAEEARAAGHPLEPLCRDLVVRGLAREVRLAPLTGDAIEGLVARRAPGAEDAPGLVDLVRERSDGNPLYAGLLVDAWAESGVLRRSDDRWSLAVPSADLAEEVPETLARLVEDRLARLDPEDRGVLHAAAVAGVEFDALAAAAGLGADEEEVEARLAELARQGSFVRAGEPVTWPGGAVSSRYGFVHHLHRDVLYSGVPPGRRARLHQRIGARLEAALGAHASERVPELVVHFVRGGDPVRAARYLRLAAERAMRRGAPREAIGHLVEGIDLVRKRSEIPGRDKLEHAFQAALGAALVATDGWGAPEAEAAFRRACAIGERLGDDDLLAPVLYGLAALHEYRAEYRNAQEIVEQVLALAPRTTDFAVETHELLACSLFHQGAFEEAIAHAEQGLEAVDPEAPRHSNAEFGDDPTVSCHAWAGLAAWFLGRRDEALERIETAIRLARRPDRAYALANTLAQAARVRQLRGEPAECQRAAAEAIELAERQGFAYSLAVGRILHGWARAMEGEAEGVDEIAAGLEAHAATGATMDRPYYLGLHAEALSRHGRHAEALETVRAATADLDAGRPFFHGPELVRLEGEILLRADPGAAEEAERLFRRALGIANERGVRATTLRAATSLAGLLAERGRRDDARAALEGPLAEPWPADDPDAQAARALLID